MKILSLVFLMNIYSCSIAQTSPEKSIVFDKEGNVIASVSYVQFPDLKEISLKDTITNNIFRIDSTHKLITAFNSTGDTLWNVNPYKVLLDKGALDEIHTPEKIKGIKLIPMPSLDTTVKKETVLKVKSVAHTVYCYIKLKTGECIFAGQD